MTKLGRTKILVYLGFGLFMTAASCAQTQRAPILEKVAKIYGIDSFDKIEAIRYTWSGEIPGVFKLSRTWEWEPKTTQVTYEGKDKDGKSVKVTYKRSELGSQPDMVKNEVDPGFINDNYWVLFPLHAYWDKSATVIDQGMFNLPLGSGTAELVPVKYPADSGYTPGDTWDLFLADDGTIQQIVLHHGGSAKPSVAPKPSRESIFRRETFSLISTSQFEVSLASFANQNHLV